MTERSDVIDRIWERDPTVWTGADEAKWLGWLDEPRRMRERVGDLAEFAAGVAADGLDTIVLLGMGGSSLAPEVLRLTFGATSLHVLDTTHPTAIRALEERIELERTLFVSASKSGSTLETRSHTDHFWKKAGKGEQWVAITDPGSSLEALAQERGFRRVFQGEPTIGGRYSALSPFGIVPAALVGIDVDALLASAEEMAERCRRDDGNPGYELGRAFGTGWREGRDKICIAETPGGFGLWAEQLIAESTGKQGKGLVPAPGESPDGSDRQAAVPELAGRAQRSAASSSAGSSPSPSRRRISRSTRSTSPTCRRRRTRRARCSRPGRSRRSTRRGRSTSSSRRRARATTSASRRSSPPTPRTTGASRRSSTSCAAKSGRVVTHGYGPRYLHSTGQLHKGGPNTGLFLQVVDDGGEELPIPGKPFGFRRLIRAQAAGDYESLKERGRRVARIHIEES